jgi:hypothetical protein
LHLSKYCWLCQQSVVDSWYEQALYWEIILKMILFKNHYLFYWACTDNFLFFF